MKAFGDEPSVGTDEAAPAALVLGRDEDGRGTAGRELPNSAVNFLLFDVEGGLVSVVWPIRRPTVAAATTVPAPTSCHRRALSEWSTIGDGKADKRT
jgi:hypothetical protein